ncbi:Ephrin_rec_like domain-containing protein, partial [Durusdinium trenchii]
MSATSLAPMMCYKHPNGLRSVLKYPNIICGSDEHTAMLVIGWILLVVFALGFVALCTFAVIQVPTWSANRRDHLVAAVRFLVFRFRLDSWWFGLPLLARGPLLSLPVVFATGYPPIQVIAIAMIMSGLLVTWKHRQDRTQLDIAR